jgi:hypothetical protein
VHCHCRPRRGRPRKPTPPTLIASCLRACRKARWILSHPLYTHTGHTRTPSVRSTRQPQARASSATEPTRHRLNLGDPARPRTFISSAGTLPLHKIAFHSQLLRHTQANARTQQVLGRRVRYTRALAGSRDLCATSLSGGSTPHVRMLLPFIFLPRDLLRMPHFICSPTMTQQ